jgi:hypothetical protein
MILIFRMKNIIKVKKQVVKNNNLIKLYKSVRPQKNKRKNKKYQI